MHHFIVFSSAYSFSMDESRPPREVTEKVRQSIYLELLELWDGERLPRGSVNRISESHEVSRWTVQRIWKAGRNVSDATQAIKAIANKKRGCVGRKITPLSTIENALSLIPRIRRRTFNHAARSTGISKGVIWRAVKKGELKRMRSKLRPKLTDANKFQRLQFALSLIDAGTRNFHSMFDRIFLD